MPTFYGPWTVSATTFESFFEERFEITGSNGSDGTYYPDEDGTPLELSVDGAEWNLDMQAKLEDPEWFSWDPRRTTAVVPPQGLTVTLDAEQISHPDAIVFNHLIVLTMVSLDPEINPPWSPPPIDLTLPEG